MGQKLTGILMDQQLRLLLLLPLWRLWAHLPQGTSKAVAERLTLPRELPEA